MNLADVNALDHAAFSAKFGDVAEHSPWVAEKAGAMRPFASRDSMIDAFSLAVLSAPHVEKLALIRAHPDLAAKARLTADSTREQKGAGLDTLSSNEFDRFMQLNELYKKKFGFPFIFAVKGATKHQILASFELRLNNSPEKEFETALAQISRIFRFRIEDRLSP